MIGPRLVGGIVPVLWRQFDALQDDIVDFAKRP